MSRFYRTDPGDPDSLKVLDAYTGPHHGTIRPGDTVVYDCPEAPWRGSPAPDGVPLIVAEIIDFGGGTPPQAVLNDGAYECGAANLRPVAEAAESGCECAITGPGHVIPIACRVHGTPCEYCGGLKSCTTNCGGGLTGE